MSELLYTRCPYCRTAFRTNTQQLALRDGKVRCGHCRKVFNARGHMVKLDPSPFLARPEYELDEDYDPMKGPQTMTLRRPVSDSSAAPAALPAEKKIEAANVRSERMARASFSWESSPNAPQRWGLLYATLLPLLVVALVAQGAHYFRGQLAANVPVLKLPLEAYCEYVGCILEPLREASSLTIESSDLQADPAHRGLMILTVTLRNRANYALAFPNLELSLTDLQGQIVARTVFASDVYIRDALALRGGIAAGEEKTVKLFLDASAASADGYKVERYYP